MGSSVTVGLVIASGTVMARVAEVGLPSVVVTATAALLMIRTQVNPFLILIAGGVVGGLNLL